MPTPPPQPPLIPAGGCLIQHALMGRYHGQVWVNTHYAFITITTPSEATLVDAATKFWTFVGAKYRQCTVETCFFDKVVTRVMGRPEIPSSLYNIPGGLTGTIETEGLPGTVAAVIKKVSVWGGKRGRGRIYVPGQPQNAQVSGFVSNAHLVLLNDLAASLEDDWGLADFGTQLPYVFSRNKAGEAGIHGARLAHAVADQLLGNQRRRRPGRGI